MNFKTMETTARYKKNCVNFRFYLYFVKNKTENYKIQDTQDVSKKNDAK